MDYTSCQAREYVWTFSVISEATVLKEEIFWILFKPVNKTTAFGLSFQRA